MSTDTAKAVSDDDLLDKIDTLKKADYLGSWGQRELSIAEAEATRRKLKRRDSASGRNTRRSEPLDARACKDG